MAVLLVLSAGTAWAQNDVRPPSPLAATLALFVCDGCVYYRALKLERGKFDGVVRSSATASADRLSRDERLAFWLNAYNTLVLRTVIDRYPIDGKSPSYPASSIRQIPGAFES